MMSEANSSSGGAEQKAAGTTLDFVSIVTPRGIFIGLILKKTTIVK
jgi:hypothetical protein